MLGIQIILLLFTCGALLSAIVFRFVGVVVIFSLGGLLFAALGTSLLPGHPRWAVCGNRRCAAGLAWLVSQQRAVRSTRWAGTRWRHTPMRGSRCWSSRNLIRFVTSADKIPVRTNSRPWSGERQERAGGALARSAGFATRCGRCAKSLVPVVRERSHPKVREDFEGAQGQEATVAPRPGGVGLCWPGQDALHGGIFAWRGCSGPGLGSGAGRD